MVCLSSDSSQRDSEFQWQWRDLGAHCLEVTEQTNLNKINGGKGAAYPVNEYFRDVKSAQDFTSLSKGYAKLHVTCNVETTSYNNCIMSTAQHKAAGIYITFVTAP